MSLAVYDKLLSDLAERCSLSDAKTLRKSRELISLLNSKRSINCSEICKVLACLELAATSTSVNFSREVAVKLSGCTKRNYTNNFNNISKLLNLNRVYSVKEICLLIGVPQISDVAFSVLQEYQAIRTIDSSALEHPMYACATILAICGKEKLSINLQRLIDVSRIRKMDLKKLSQEFSKLYEKISIDISKKERKIKNEDQNTEDRNTEQIRDYYSRDKTDEMSDNKFKDWKRRMLEDDS